MNLGGAIFLVAAFLGLALWLRMPALAGRATDTARSALRTLRDRSLDEEAKERAIRAASIVMFGLFAKIVVWSVVALGVPIGLLYLAQSADWLDLDVVFETTLRWEFLLGATVVGFAVWAPTRRRLTE